MFDLGDELLDCSRRNVKFIGSYPDGLATRS